MKKFSQYIAEGFDKPYPVTVKKIDDLEYGANVNLPDGSDLSIEFTGIDWDDFVSWNIVFHRNGSVKVTGEGDAMRIFATVMDAVKKFIKKVKPEEIRFSASKEAGMSRTRLYKKLIDRFARSLGYKVNLVATTPEEDIFYLQRVGKGKK